MARPKKSSKEYSDKDLILRAQRDPIWWMQDGCGWTLWQKQKEIVTALLTHKRVAVPAAFGVGKTYIASRITAHWLNTYGPSIVVTTAPTSRQVKDLLWAEIKDAYHSSKMQLGGEVLTTDIRTGHPKWFATGFATNEEHIDKFTGYHSPNMLLIFDQACGIHKQIWTAGEGLLTSSNCRWLALSNTTDDKSEFANICMPDRKSDYGGICEDPACPGCSQWKIIKIKAHDSPNVIAKKNVFPGILSYDYVEQKKLVWRPGDPLWEVYIEANFVEAGAMTVLHPSMVTEILETNEIAPDFENISLGVDVGDEGSDPTICAVALGNRLGFIERVLGNNPMQVVTFVERVWEKVKRLTDRHPTTIYIDCIGVGSGVAARLVEKGYPVIGINVGRKANREEEFLNKRIEMAWQIREKAEMRCMSWKPMYHTEDALMQMLREDMGIRYRPLPSQKIALEDKRVFRSRMRRSSDLWDAMCMAFADNTTTPGLSVLEGVFDGRAHQPSFADEMNAVFDPQVSDDTLRVLAKLVARGPIDESDFGDGIDI